MRSPVAPKSCVNVSSGKGRYETGSRENKRWRVFWKGWISEAKMHARSIFHPVLSSAQTYASKIVCMGLRGTHTWAEGLPEVSTQDFNYLLLDRLLIQPPYRYHHHRMPSFTTGAAPCYRMAGIIQGPLISLVFKHDQLSLDQSIIFILTQKSKIEFLERCWTILCKYNQQLINLL